MGFYLQGGELIQTLTITENVAMPLRVNGMPAREATRTATELLGQLLNESTAKLSKKLASDYSGGEVQRVALARAIIHKPRFLFVDEPTSQLDQVSKKQVLELVKNRAKQCNMTVFMITHDEEIAREFSTCLMFLQRLPDGWNADTSSDFDRDADGYAKPVRYETLVGHQWTQTDSSFKTIVSSQQELGDAP